MNRLRRAALLTELVDRLAEHGSWCGETHIQKSVFLAQEMLNVPFGFEFILYKHGPYSFDLRDEITSLRADDLLELETQPVPYGPRLFATHRNSAIRKRYQVTLTSFSDRLEFIAQKIGNRGVAELERLATAFYVTENPEGASADEHAKRLVKLKPHVSLAAAKKAVAEIHAIIVDADEIESSRVV